jgi:hypothetical protein
MAGLKTSIARITQIMAAKHAGRYVADYNPANLYAHVTAVAGVKLESNGFYIRPDTSDFVNLNGDSWDVNLLEKKASDFVNGYNFHEHQYDPARAKGTVLDVLVKESHRTLYIDALIEVRDEEMKQAVKTGSIDSVSIGCIYSYVTCTQCGNRYKPEDVRCAHLSRGLRSYFEDENKIARVISELTGSADNPSSVKFYEISWVRNPAFGGGVLWDCLKTASGSSQYYYDKRLNTYLPYIKRFYKSRTLFDRIFYLYICFMVMAYYDKGAIFNMLHAVIWLRYNRMLKAEAYDEYLSKFSLTTKQKEYIIDLIEEYDKLAN